MTYQHLTERECAAIRYNAFGPTNWQYNHHDMTVTLPTTKDHVRLPINDIQRFMEAWRKSGLWSLRGADYPHATLNSRTGDEAGALPPIVADKPRGGAKA